MTTNKKGTKTMATQRARPAAARSNGHRKVPPNVPPVVPADAEQDWTKLPVQEQLRRTAWLFEELKYSVRVAFAQLALQNPQVQQQLAARLVQQGGQF